jgi:hypothetical protein
MRSIGSNNSRHNETIGENNAAPPLVVSCVMLASVLIVSTNCMVMCIVAMRKWLLKKIYYVFVLGLSICDMVVGLTLPMGTLAYAFPEIFASFYVCSLSYIVILIAEGASLLHALLICVERFSVLSNRKLFHRMFAIRHKYACLIVPWLMSSVYFGVCSFVWLDRDLSSQCSFVSAYGDHFIDMTRATFSMYFILFVLIVSVYAVTLTYLHRYRSYRYNLNTKYIVRNNREFSGSSRPVTSTSPEIDRITISLRLLCSNNIERSASPLHKYLQESRSSRAGEPTARREIRALVTVGCLIVLLTVFMLPLLVILFLEASFPFRFPREPRNYVVFLGALNSLANPVMYFLRIKELRPKCCTNRHVCAAV